MSSKHSDSSRSSLKPEDKDVQRLRSLAETKHSIAEELKSSPEPADQEEGQTQEVQAEHLAQEVHTRAAATGAKVPRSSKLP